MYSWQGFDTIARRPAPGRAGRARMAAGVLKGAVFFTTDLVRALAIPAEFDFMAVSSYGSATHSSGVTTCHIPEARRLSTLTSPLWWATLSWSPVCQVE